MTNYSNYKIAVSHIDVEVLYPLYKYLVEYTFCVAFPLFGEKIKMAGRDSLPK